MDERETRSSEIIQGQEEEPAEETAGQNEMMYRYFIKTVIGAYLIYLAYRTWSARADVPAERLIFVTAAAAVFLIAGIWFAAGSAVKLVRVSRIPAEETGPGREEEKASGTDVSAPEGTDSSKYLE